MQNLDSRTEFKIKFQDRVSKFVLVAASMLVGMMLMAAECRASESVEPDWAGLAPIEPGDDAQTSCEADCTPTFDGDVLFDPKLWECEVVSQEDYETGNYPGDTICRPI